MIFIILGSIPFIAYIKFLNGNKKIFTNEEYIKTVVDKILHFINIQDITKDYTMLEFLITTGSLLQFLDTKKNIPEQIFRVVNYLKLNEKEYNSISEYNRANYRDKIIATLGENGACYNNVYFQVKSPKNTIDVSGAGDTFMAALCYHYMISENMGQSIIFANEKASEVVSKRGVAIV